MKVMKKGLLGLLVLAILIILLPESGQAKEETVIKIESQPPLETPAASPVVLNKSASFCNTLLSGAKIGTFLLCSGSRLRSSGSYGDAHGRGT